MRGPDMDGCAGCDEDRQRTTITRRGLLRAMGIGAATAVVAPALGAADLRVAYAADPGWAGDTVVVLSLRGGFDGLSAVVPAGDPDYPTLRPGIGVPAAQTLPLDAMFGLHPALAPLHALHQNGKAAFVHATGLPAPNRSHFAAMDEVERAAPGTSARTGWLDRVLGLHTGQGPFGAVQMGSTSMPFAFAGPNPEIGMSSLQSFQLSGAGNATERARWNAALTSFHDRGDAAVRGAAAGTLGALDTAATLTATAYTPANGAVYPNTDLGNALKEIARLVKANVGLRVATLDEGNWDMHADLGRVDSGWMHDKLVELGAALAAFATDLGPGLDGVTLLTLSEFGRRVEENRSGGVDHGWGNAMILLGGHVVSGVHGVWPGLTQDALVDGDLRATTDYRAVLADVLGNRAGADTTSLQTVLPGWNGVPIGVTTP